MQALQEYKNTPVPNDALIAYTQIALNAMSIPRKTMLNTTLIISSLNHVLKSLNIAFDEEMFSQERFEENDDEIYSGWEPEPTMIEHLHQIENAIRYVKLTNNNLET